MPKKKLCKNCKHWKQTTDWEKRDNSGRCTNILSSFKIEFELKCGSDGGYIDYALTNRDFYCALWEVNHA